MDWGRVGYLRQLRERERERAPTYGVVNERYITFIKEL